MKSWLRDRVAGMACLQGTAVSRSSPRRQSHHPAKIEAAIQSGPRTMWFYNAALRHRAPFSKCGKVRHWRLRPHGCGGRRRFYMGRHAGRRSVRKPGNDAVAAISPCARVRELDDSDPFRRGLFGLRLSTRIDWDGLKYRVGMHCHHSFLLRCLQEPNYSCQVPSRVGRKGKTRETKWHAAN